MAVDAHASQSDTDERHLTRNSTTGSLFTSGAFHCIFSPLYFGVVNALQSASLEQNTLARRLRLILAPSSLRLTVGAAVPITGTLEVEGSVAEGIARIDVDARYLTLLSPEIVRFPAGSSVRQLEWSVGAIASSKTSSDGLTVVSITASAGDLMQSAQVVFTID